jgi:two-component system LytT family response regulator
VIFVTAHDEHALRAFDVHALDYVLKPFGRIRFRAAVSRALERLRALDALTLQRTLASIAADRVADRSSGVLTLDDAPKSGRSALPRRLGVRLGTRVVLVDIADVDWIEAAGDYARIHAGKQVYLVSHRMQGLEKLLDPAEFFRIHRSLIVNLSRVREMYRESDGGGTIVLTGGVRLRVARGRWEVLQQALRIEEC